MGDKSALRQISIIIEIHDGWKAELLTRLRAIIKQAYPAVTEEVKWKTPSRPEGLPVWSHHGILCIAEIFKNDIKLTFFKGAKMDDPKNLFNARLNSSTDRAIAFHEGDSIDEDGIKELVLEAVALNEAKFGK